MTVAELPQTAATCACGHSRPEHDAIASRYCDATAAGALPRGCICPATQPSTTRVYDRR
ncbi:MAG: RGCVC family protein [Sporichthyaceae bacterium]